MKNILILLGISFVVGPCYAHNFVPCISLDDLIVPKALRNKNREMVGFKGYDYYHKSKTGDTVELGMQHVDDDLDTSYLELLWVSNKQPCAVSMNMLPKKEVGDETLAYSFMVTIFAHLEKSKKETFAFGERIEPLCRARNPQMNVQLPNDIAIARIAENDPWGDYAQVVHVEALPGSAQGQKVLIDFCDIQQSTLRTAYASLLSYRQEQVLKRTITYVHEKAGRHTHRFEVSYPLKRE